MMTEVKDKAEKAPPHPSAVAAAERMAERFGLSKRHFLLRGVAGPRAEFGYHALTGSLLHYNPFRDEPLPSAIEASTRDLALEHYAPGEWQRQRTRMHNAFLRRRKFSLFSPLDGEPLPALGSVFGDRFEYVLLQGVTIRVAVILGSTCYGILYVAEGVFIHLTDYEERRGGVLQPLFKLITVRFRQLDNWIALADRKMLSHCFLIADNRPAHYISQTLGFIHTHLDQVTDFLRGGGTSVIVSDWAFLDPRKVFPVVSQEPVLSVKSDRLGAMCLNMGMNLHRIARGNASLEWVAALLRRLGPRVKEPSSFDVLISIDASKKRFVNQTEAIGLVLRTLKEACARADLKLTVLWDGWTLAEGHLSPADQVVIDAIDEMAADIKEAAGGGFDEIFVRGTTFEDKLRQTAPCDIALATHGTASIMPSIMHSTPTVTYHVPDVMQITGYAATDSWYPVDTDAIDQVGDGASVAHMRKFRIEPEALLLAVSKAAAAAGIEVSIGRSL